MESPCILVCSIETESGYCHGCGRTSAEITGWTLYSDERRRELMAELPARVASLEKRPRRETKRSQLAKLRNQNS
ncbi:MAG: DUF1289 domain-containing protein [Pseudomonadales bacterium]|nr:DUF1289 domain-containing protein [Pseudomonadales bacterium]